MEQERCESCHQLFNWWDLLWDLEEDKEVCVNCYHNLGKDYCYSYDESGKA